MLPLLNIVYQAYLIVTIYKNALVSGYENEEGEVIELKLSKPLYVITILFATISNVVMLL